MREGERENLNSAELCTDKRLVWVKTDKKMCLTLREDGRKILLPSSIILVDNYDNLMCWAVTRTWQL